MVSVTKDRKGNCWFISHRRCGVTEGIFVTPEELVELSGELRKVIEEEL
jgi:hypothetical protein